MPPVFFFWNDHDGDGKQSEEVEDDEPLEHDVAGQEHNRTHCFCERGRQSARHVAAFVEDDVEVVIEPGNRG